MVATGYPKVTKKAWGILRARAASAPTSKFTPSAVAALMRMSSPESARDNTVTPLRRLGLFDDDGALTDLGNRWRVDATYAEACQEILDAVYPSELGVLVTDDGAADPQRVRTWFDQQGFGSSNARQMAQTYVMIAKKEIPESSGAERAKIPTTSAKAKATTPGSKRGPKVSKPEPRVPAVPPPASAQPAFHLDVQIHIPADATPEQIDRIFASMAKHLYAK